MSIGRRQPSCGGTSRMTRECQVRFCERLGVQFPGPTRHSRHCRHTRVSGSPEERTVARGRVYEYTPRLAGGHCNQMDLCRTSWGVEASRAPRSLHQAGVLGFKAGSMPDRSCDDRYCAGWSWK